MSEIASSSNQISIAQYVKKVNDRYGKNNDILESIAKNANDLVPKIKAALFETGIDFAEVIQSSLMTKENTKCTIILTYDCGKIFTSNLKVFVANLKRCI